MRTESVVTQISGRPPLAVSWSRAGFLNLWATNAVFEWATGQGQKEVRITLSRHNNHYSAGTR